MAKKIDKAGHWLIKGNPLSKEGVYMYSGKVIDPNNANGFNLQPDTLYPVYRPKSELASACESFNGVQVRNEHEMMGDGAGMRPADSIPTGGTVFNVRMDGDTMIGDMRLFGDELRHEIEGGKKQLSLGYFCRYKKESGDFNGQHYDFVQYELEGNHVALVKEGRMGSGVRVFDSITFDSLEIPMKKVHTKDGNEPKTDVREEIGKMLEGKDEDVLAKCKDAIEGILNPKDDPAKGGEDEDEEKPDEKTGDDPCPYCGNEVGLTKEGKDEDEEPEEKPEGEDEDKEKSDEDEIDDCGDEDEEDKPKCTGDSRAMDMKEVMREISRRDRIADGVAPLIGSFDHSEMTAKEVAVYACDKLELPKDGDCIARVEGFIAARAKNFGVTTATDAAEESSTFIKDYLK